MAVTVVNVEGMACEHCVKAVQTAVKALAGISDVVVSLSENTVTVTHDGRATDDLLKTAIEEQGYDVVS